MHDWSPLLEKITKKLAGWKAKLLLLAGRALLLNAIISPILVMFWMTNFILPAGIINKIDRLCSTFLWNGNEKSKAGMSLLNRSTVYRPKEMGGMGITNLKILNQIIFCKWWWQAYTDQTLVPIDKIRIL